jgi:hypothetical protein
MHVSLFTYADKRPDFIQWQVDCFKRCLQDDWDLTVYDNAAQPMHSQQIQAECRRLGLPCRLVEMKGHYDPTSACGVPLNWSWHAHLRKLRDRIVVVIDSDMFLLKPFSVEQFLGDCHVAAMKARRAHVKYLWNGICFFNMATLPDPEQINWDHGLVDNVNTDVGGHIHYYLQRHPQLRVRDIPTTWKIIARHANYFVLPEAIVAEYKDEYGYELYAEAFLHYTRGSNWDGQSRDHHEAKTRLTEKLIRGCIDGSLVMPDKSYCPEPDRWEPDTYPTEISWDFP